MLLVHYNIYSSRHLVNVASKRVLYNIFLCVLGAVLCCAALDANIDNDEGVIIQGEKLTIGLGKQGKRRAISHVPNHHKATNISNRFRSGSILDGIEIMDTGVSSGMCIKGKATLCNPTLPVTCSQTETSPPALIEDCWYYSYTKIAHSLR